MNMYMYTHTSHTHTFMHTLMHKVMSVCPFLWTHARTVTHVYAHTHAQSYVCTSIFITLSVCPLFTYTYYDKSHSSTLHHTCWYSLAPSHSRPRLYPLVLASTRSPSAYIQHPPAFPCSLSFDFSCSISTPCSMTLGSLQAPPVCSGTTCGVVRR